jgi:MFS family permease
MDPAKRSSVATDAPTRVRYGVLGFACSLSMITYLDRVCFASAAIPLVTALGLESIADLKWAFTAFAFAYAAFEIPSGWLGDVFGPRLVLIRIVLWWSAFTALTGLVGLSIGGIFLGLGSLVLIRLFFGMGEAGAYPNITRALHNWFPFQERGTAQGAVWMSARLMGGLTPAIWLLLIEGIGQTGDGTTAVGRTPLGTPTLDWRQTFWLFGGLGVVWCVLFALWFRNRPEEKRNVNSAELELIRAGRADEEGHQRVPWLRLLTSGNLWALCLMYFCGAYGWYFNITYLHTFLEQQHGVDPKSLLGAVYKGGPLWMGAIGCLVGGWLTDGFIRRTGDRRWGRRIFGLIGHGTCAICYTACLFAPSAFTFFVAISLGAFCNDLTMASAWACCQDIGKRYAAVVAGCMNTIGNLGGAVAGWVTGYILDQSLAQRSRAIGATLGTLSSAQKGAALLQGYQINFVTFAAIYVVAALLWLRIDATQPVIGDQKPI